MLKLPIDLSNVITDRVTYLFTKQGQSNMEISGFALASGDFSSAPAISSNDISLLLKGVPLSTSDHGGTNGPGQTAVPDGEAALITWAGANSWNLIKYDSKGNFQVLNAADVVADPYDITFDAVGDTLYDLDFGTDSGDNYQRGVLKISDAAGNTVEIVLDGTNGAFTNQDLAATLTGDDATWSVYIYGVTVNGNYVEEEFAAPLTITDTV